MEMSAATERLVEQGQQAWLSLQKVEAWDQWRLIGYAIEAGRKDIMDALGINDPASNSKKFKDEIGIWLKETGFHQIDKGVRSRLHSCMDHLIEIEAWRKTLDPNERVSLNHPNSIWRKFKVTIEDAVPRPRGPDPRAAVIVELQERVDAYEVHVAELTNERDALRAETDRLKEAAAWEQAKPAGAWNGAENVAALRARYDAVDDYENDPEFMQLLRQIVT